jgi:hypothetical protein
MIMGKIDDKNLISAVPYDVAKSFLPLIRTWRRDNVPWPPKNDIRF